MALDPSFLEELRHRVPLTTLIGRRNKLVRSGRNWKTCCPFHGEKTPSFYIYEDHFHCFGCGVHGDAVSFIMQSDGSSFLEAVERLAGEAGLEMPRADQQAREQAQRTQSLVDVLALAQKFYRQGLYKPEGRAGLAYLRQRGLSEQTLERFGLGWSGDGRSLIPYLQKEGVTLEQCAKAGLMRMGEDGNPRGELFFNRVTFPIRDRKGRFISFGGRILGSGQPKYVNGPETDLFSKRRQLFNLDLATQSVRNGQRLIVVEGYMDVIALDQAGLSGAVAPLGTALGQEQLALLWRLSSQPVLCLDGDIAGQRAALRACEVALPVLSDDKTLLFCRLEGGDDPDSLVRREGAAAMEERLATARPMVEELFALLVAGEHNPGPERRTILRKRLVELAGLITDKTLASEYRSTLLDLFFGYFRPKKWGGTAGRSASRLDINRSGIRGYSTDKPVFQTGQGGVRPVARGDHERLRLLSALLLAWPLLLAEGEIEQAYMQLALPEELDRLRNALLEWADQAVQLDDPAALQAWMSEQGLEEICRSTLHGRLPRRILPEEGTGTTPGQGHGVLDEQIVENWWHFYGLVNFASFEKEVQKAVQETIMQAYATPLNSQSKESLADSSMQIDGEKAIFPPNLAARMRVLEALKRGERLELDEETQ